MTEAFLRAWEKTLGMEGGYVDNPHDPGGRTIYGITERDHPDLFKDGLPSLAAAQRRAHDGYWAPARLDMIHSGLMQVEMFDTAYNCGQRRAILFVQRAYNLLSRDVKWVPLVTDGAIGPKTIRAVNLFTGKAESWELALFKWANWFQGEYYKRIDNVHFLRGWAKRL